MSLIESSPHQETVAKALALAARQTERHPSDAQKAAGNYAKGKWPWRGLTVTIENPKGSLRQGVSKSGHKWQVRMPAPYGYFLGSVGHDGDHVDTYVGDDHARNKVYIIDQVNDTTGKFDENKCFIDYQSRDAALATYEKAFSDGKAKDRIGAVTEMSVERFKEWLASGDTKKPFGDIRKGFAAGGTVMPLEKSGSRQAVSNNIRAELGAGKPRAQAIAIALNTARRYARKAFGGRVGMALGGQPPVMQSGFGLQSQSPPAGPGSMLPPAPPSITGPSLGIASTGFGGAPLPNQPGAPPVNTGFGSTASPPPPGAILPPAPSSSPSPTVMPQCTKNPPMQPAPGKGKQVGPVSMPVSGPMSGPVSPQPRNYFGPAPAPPMPTPAQPQNYFGPAPGTLLGQTQPSPGYPNSTPPWMQQSSSMPAGISSNPFNLPNQGRASGGSVDDDPHQRLANHIAEGLILAGQYKQTDKDGKGRKGLASGGIGSDTAAAEVDRAKARNESPIRDEDPNLMGGHFDPEILKDILRTIAPPIPGYNYPGLHEGIEESRRDLEANAARRAGMSEGEKQLDTLKSLATTAGPLAATYANRYLPKAAMPLIASAGAVAPFEEQALGAHAVPTKVPGTVQETPSGALARRKSDIELNDPTLQSLQRQIDEQNKIAHAEPGTQVQSNRIRAAAEASKLLGQYNERLATITKGSLPWATAHPDAAAAWPAVQVLAPMAAGYLAKNFGNLAERAGRAPWNRAVDTAETNLFPRRGERNLQLAEHATKTAQGYLEQEHGPLMRTVSDIMRDHAAPALAGAAAGTEASLFPYQFNKANAPADSKEHQEAVRVLGTPQDMFEAAKTFGGLGALTGWATPHLFPTAGPGRRPAPETQALVKRFGLEADEAAASGEGSGFSGTAHGLGTLPAVLAPGAANGPAIEPPLMALARSRLAERLPDYRAAAGPPLPPSGESSQRALPASSSPPPSKPLLVPTTSAAGTKHWPEGPPMAGKFMPDDVVKGRMAPEDYVKGKGEPPTTGKTNAQSSTKGKPNGARTPEDIDEIAPGVPKKPDRPPGGDSHQNARAGGGAIRKALDLARHYAKGGRVHVGPVIGPSGGRDDALPVNVASGSYIVPADAVSGMPGAGNNTLAGMKILEKMFGKSQPTRAAGGAVPIKISAGEFTVSPEAVAKYGGGGYERGPAPLARG